MACVVALVGAAAGPAVALEPNDFTGDIKAPEVHWMTLTPGSADVTLGPATFTIKARVTDDLSGVQDTPAVNWSLSSEETGSYATHFQLESGDRYDGVWKATIPIPRYAAPGRYLIGYNFPDRVGNGHPVGRYSDPVPSGFPSGFDITDANPDATPGTVTGVSVSPSLLDTRFGPASVNISVDAADTQSGVKHVVVFLRAPADERAIHDPPFMTLASGTAAAGRWTGTATVPRYTRQGTWSLEVRVIDELNNIRYYEPADLTANGTPARFDVISDEDTVAPRVIEASITPTEVNVHDADQTVKVRLRLTDDKSGIYDIWGASGSVVQAYAIDPVTQQGSGTGYIPRASGTARDGWYEADVVVRRSSATGLRPWNIYADDAVGNFSYASDGEKATLGVLPLLVYNVPFPPSLLGADAGDGAVQVHWDAPTSDGGASIDGYIVTASPSGARIEVSADAHTVVLGGLPNDVAQTLTVVARNKAGTSDISAAVTATPRAGAALVPPTTAGPPTPVPGSGYWMLESSGRVHNFGSAPRLGDLTTAAGAVDLEPTPSRQGYWVTDTRGAVRRAGDAPYLGGSPALRLGETVTSMSATHSGQGYWLFSDQGRVFAYGDASFLGDMANRRLNGPVLDSIPTPTGHGYYMVASDGGVFAFGDAAYSGSMGGRRLNAPVQSLVPDPDGAGYWLVASDGGIFAFGAPFLGSMGSVRLARPVTGMVGSPTGRGYLMVAEDGGIFAFGDAGFHGSLGASPPLVPVVAVAPV